MKHGQIDMIPVGTNNDIRFYFTIDERLRNPVSIEFRRGTVLRWHTERACHLVISLQTDIQNYICTRANDIVEMFQQDGPTLETHGMSVRAELIGDDTGDGCMTEIASRMVPGGEA